ncbi:MAG: glycosyltransferase family 4 protein [Patescibacteria group bacterium]|jgi:glycosyltransferase involved in cell wall biosynthesis
MKILHTVEFYSPSVGGMQEVVRQLSERLVRLGHDVTVATTKLLNRNSTEINGVHIREFSISGNQVRGYQGNITEYQQFLQQQHFDVMTNFAAQQWATDLALPILSVIKSKKVFVPTGFSGLYVPEYKSYFERMTNWMQQYEMNVFLSEHYRDIDFARQHNIGNIRVISNGAASDEFLPTSTCNIREQLSIPQQHFLILSVGSHSGAKGHAEAIKIFTKARIKNATLLIIGNSFGGGCTYSCQIKSWLNKFNIKHRLFADKKIIIINCSRSETVAAYQQANLFLFPSNLECSPLVLFESMAAHLPFLTTDVGNAREIINWSQGGLLLPTRFTNNGQSYAILEQSVVLLERIYQAVDLRKQLGQAGFTAWQNKFTWEKITKQYEQLYQHILRV